MKTKHIIKILDQTNFPALSREDSAMIKNHAAVCRECLEAVRTAQLSSILLTTKMNAETPVPTIFFQAKVLHAWREKQNFQKPLAAFRRWWQASAVMVLAMLFAVGGLICFSIFAANSSQMVQQTEAAKYNLYSTDSIILNQKIPKTLTTEQALEVLENFKTVQK